MTNLPSKLIIFFLLFLVSCASYRPADLKEDNQEAIRVMFPEAYPLR